MAMAQTAFRTRSALNRHRMAAADWSQRAKMPLFQAFFRPSSSKVTDGLCIKDATTIDPACGSGNFLTETYLSLRRLENEIIYELQGGQIVFGEAINPIQVSIGQFYGLEIKDFAVTVAKTELWIVEGQMMKETEGIIRTNLDFLPLKSYANVDETDGLKKDWNEAVPSASIDYIMGNPPFIGARLMQQGSKQKLHVERIFGNIRDVQNLDYVTCWVKVAADYI